jgi:hypothetical protein
MKNERVLYALARRRAEIIAEIEAAQAKLCALDATRRLFAPACEPPIVPLPPPPRAALDGDLSRIVLNALRRTAEPISSHALALRLLSERDLNVADRLLVSLTARRVNACLTYCRRRGYVRSRKGPGGKFSVWELAG